MPNASFLHDEWCGFAWTPWLPLGASVHVHRALPTTGGLYRVRAVGTGRLAYIGQTGGSLRARLRALARNAYRERMPWNDPHTAAPGVWAYRQDGLVFECAAAVFEADAPTRRAAEDYLLWRYRTERGESTLLNHGQFHPQYTKSSSRKRGSRGGPKSAPLVLEETAARCAPPLAQDGRIGEADWMGLEWTEAISLNEAVPPASPGVYCLLEETDRGDIDRLDIVYVGEADSLRRRLAHHAHTKRGLRVRWTTASAVKQHRCEWETDLLGGYYELHRRPPRLQYGAGS